MADIGRTLYLDEIGRLAERAASYWSSIMLAAERGDAHTVTIHLKQAAAVSRAVFQLVKELDEEKAAQRPTPRGPNMTPSQPAKVEEEADVQDRT
jgi:hypothetical protein